MALGTARNPLNDDPDLGMGLALLAQQRKERIIMAVKIGVVWIGLIVFLLAVLLQLRFEPAYVFQHYNFVLIGLWTTIGISLASILFATILALLGALGRLSNNALAQGLSGFYVSLIRGTPLLIQIYLIYLGLPQIGQQLNQLGYPQLGRLFTLTAIQSGILALSLNYGAYMTEIFRAGIQSISHGQREAAESIGMTRWQYMRRIILPQAVRVIIPDIGNQFIAVLHRLAVHGHNRVAHLQAVRLEDVALLAVGVLDEGDSRRPVRVVLDGDHLPGDVALVALEVDHAVVPLVPAAAPSGRQLAVVVPAARLAQRLGQRLVRLGGGDLLEHLHRLEAAAGGRRLVFANRHVTDP